MFASQNPEQRSMSEADYLAFEEVSELRHEFVNGEVFAMTGAMVRHNAICNNISTSLANQLADKDCLVLSDTRVKVEAKVSYRYPDILVICGQVDYAPQRQDTVLNPVLLIEVLSPATALVDHNQKLDEYLQIPSLQDYLLVAQDKSRVERYARHQEGWLYTQVTDENAAIRFEALGCQLKLSTIYKKLGLT